MIESSLLRDPAGYSRDAKIRNVYYYVFENQRACSRRSEPRNSAQNAEAREQIKSSAVTRCAGNERFCHDIERKKIAEKVLNWLFRALCRGKKTND